MDTGGGWTWGGGATFAPIICFLLCFGARRVQQPPGPQAYKPSCHPQSAIFLHFSFAFMWIRFFFVLRGRACAAAPQPPAPTCRNIYTLRAQMQSMMSVFANFCSTKSQASFLKPDARRPKLSVCKERDSCTAIDIARHNRCTQREMKKMHLVLDLCHHSTFLFFSLTMWQLL